MPNLSAKPFGKDGVRLVFSGASAGVTILEVRAAAADDSAAADDDDSRWTAHGDGPLATNDGVVVVKTSTASSGRPRTAEWRLRTGSVVTAPVTLAPRPSTQAAAQSASPLATIQPLDDAELAFNILQWFGTIVLDFRAEGRRLRESVLITDASSVSSLPIKDDAVCLGALREAVSSPSLSPTLIPTLTLTRCSA